MQRRRVEYTKQAKIYRTGRGSAERERPHTNNNNNINLRNSYQDIFHNILNRTQLIVDVFENFDPRTVNRKDMRIFNSTNGRNVDILHIIITYIFDTKHNNKCITSF